MTVLEDPISKKTVELELSLDLLHQDVKVLASLIERCHDKLDDVSGLHPELVPDRATEGSLYLRLARLVASFNTVYEQRTEAWKREQFMLDNYIRTD